MDNQANEDELDKTVHIDICTGASGECVYVNDYRVKGGKPWGRGTITKSIEIKTDELLRAIEPEIQTLIRTEKLKLLAEVRERVVGEKKDQEYRLIDTEYASIRKEKVYLSDGVSRNKLRSEQRIELAKLKAEL